MPKEPLSNGPSFDGQDLVTGSDGLPIREVGAWSKDKHHFLSRYIDAFTTAMAGKWAGLGYVDLFSGPGMCKVRDTAEEIEGSPLLALGSPRPFDLFAFADVSTDALSAIQRRFEAKGGPSSPLVYAGDCNERIVDVTRDLPTGHLYLAFIDPTGLDVHFETIRALTSHRKVDLIISFMDRLDLIRNIDIYHDRASPKLDLFLGASSNWRQRYADLPNRSPENITRMTLDAYREQLGAIGYKHFGQPKRITGRAGAADTPFYLLLFASKHPLGAKLWNETSKKDRGGQRSLF